jgi:hypothetical protein
LILSAKHLTQKKLNKLFVQISTYFYKLKRLIKLKKSWGVKNKNGSEGGADCTPGAEA